MIKTDTDVLIIGGGPVGLAASIELGMRGVRVLVVERNTRGGSAPRAKTTNVRTRTHLRRWGIAARLADASPLGITYPNDIIFTTGLASQHLARIPNAFNADPKHSSDYPEHAQWIPQYTLERVLREHAQTLPTVELRFDSAFVTADQDQDGVTAIVKFGTDVEQEVSARYLVGADGARSAVRDLIGAKMVGAYGFSRHYNVVFRAPGLASAHRQGRGVMYWQVQRGGNSLIGPMDRDDKWFFMPTGLKEGERLSKEEVAAAIVTTTGIDLPYEILSSDEWKASRLIADRYSKGRIFLAGDACHLHSPFGGYGMNMGVGDAVDLGWKIEARLKGWGAPELLESYEAERRPVHEAVIEEAVANHAFIIGRMWCEGLDDNTPEGAALRQQVGAQIEATKRREFYTLGTVLGLGYENSPIVTYDGTPAPLRDGEVYKANARPGQLAPHAWLANNESIYDLFGQGFALIIAESADVNEVAMAQQDARNLGVPLALVRPVGVPVKELYQAELTLVRPDQHVAWRGTRWHKSVLDRAIGSRVDQMASEATG